MSVTEWQNGKKGILRILSVEKLSLDLVIESYICVKGEGIQQM